MSEVPSPTINHAIEQIDWRPARPEDGPVWVALTREGRAPLLPHEALTEPTQRLLLDRREREEELHYFLSELPKHSGTCFLLWRAGRVLGRLCFRREGNQASLWGLALLPTLNERMIRSIVQSIIDHASDAGAAQLTAVFEASHLPAFTQKGFKIIRRYTTMVAPTQDSDEELEEQEKSTCKPETPPPPYRIRPITPDDHHALEALKQDTASPPEKYTPAQSAWLEEFDQLMRGQRYEPIQDGAYVAEGYTEQERPASLLGVIQVSQWRRVAVITHVYVARSQRRRRIGTALVEHARDQLARLHYTTVIATINEHSRAQKFFRFLGFRDIQQCTLVGSLKLSHQRQPRIAGT